MSKSHVIDELLFLYKQDLFRNVEDRRVFLTKQQVDDIGPHSVLDPLPEIKPNS